MNDEASIVSKVWNLANVLRDDGVSYGDYLEQLTYLLFLKMVEEFARPPYNRPLAVPEGYDWGALTSRRGADLESHYAQSLRKLADYRTNIHHTLKKKPMRLADLEDFITCYNPANRHQRKETWSEDDADGRWRKFTYEAISARDKTNLDIFWLKDETLTDLDNLPDPDILAGEIIDHIEAGLASFKEIVYKVDDARAKKAIISDGTHTKR